MFYRQFSKDNGSSFYGSGSDPRDPTNPPSGGGSSSHSGGGGGDKRDGWMCPNCGELCSHVDLFICEFLDSGPLVRRSAIPKVLYSEASVPKLVYKLVIYLHWH